VRTFLTEAWSLRVPIVGAPMSPQAGPRLAAAISKSGGLGLIGVSSAQAVERVLADASECEQDAKGLPFGIGLMSWAVSARPELLAAAIAAKPFAIALSFGDIAAHAAQVRAAGIELISQVQDRESALAAEAAVATLLVAQGTEAGGHTGGIGTLPLLQIVLESVSVPVLAAGGIATGRGLAAVLAAGAQGAWIGTPFLLAEEARNNEAQRERVLGANETDTVLTSVFDLGQGIAWPPQYRGRALRNAFSERWVGHESELVEDAAARAGLVRAVRAQDYKTAQIYAGQSVGLLDRVEPAGDIVHRIASEAELHLQAVARMLNSAQ
jgi:nitronate monooxygenase